MKNQLFIKRSERDNAVSVRQGPPGRIWRDKHVVRQRCLWQIIAAVITFCVLSGAAWSLENYSVGNPIGPSTVPPSSIRSGLTPTPNTIRDNSGNLIITGSVRGGSYSRGPLPYRTSTALGAPPGSSALQGSALPDDFDRYLERYRVQPYYSLTGAITAITPARSSILAPSNAKIDEQAPDTFGLGEAPKKEIPPEQSTTVSDTRLLQTPLSPQQIEKLGSESITGYPGSTRLTYEQYQKQMEQLQRELQQIKEKTDALKQRLTEKDESLQIPTGAEQGEGTRQQLETPGVPSAVNLGPTPGEITTLAPQKQPEPTIGEPSLTPTAPLQKQEPQDLVPSTGKERVWSPETYEQLKKQLDNLKASQEKEKASAVTEKGPESAVGGEEQLSKEKSYFEVLRKRQPGAEDTYSNMPSTMGLEKTSGTTKETSALEEVARLSPTQLSAEARRIMGPHKDIASLSEAKFNEYILAAQTYLKEGKFYRAADSYGLASFYKKDDPAAYGGRGQALFAAGEYVSSALYISRAIETSAAYAKTKVDLASILGDKDRLESRISDVEEWLKKSDSVELEFLLGYIYYQTGRLDQAKQAIDAAYAKKPQWPAVQVVKKAIDEATGSPKTK
jgi:tetratricopeptide (TPR) repeat protein